MEQSAVVGEEAGEDDLTAQNKAREENRCSTEERAATGDEVLPFRAFFFAFLSAEANT